jgi:anti-repressor protein
MNEIIKIKQHQGRQLVDARELHEFLEVQTRFNDWVINRIDKFGFEENQDFICFTENLVKPQGGRPSKEYGLTLDMAKELCMVENNDKGRQARRYFIDMEMKAKAISAKEVDFSDPTTVLRLAQNWKEEQEKRIEAEEKALVLAEHNRKMKPKALFADAVATSDRSCLVGELAKVLKQNGIDMGQNRMFKWLRAKGYLGSRGEYYNQPTQKAMELGLFEMKKTTINKPDGTVLISTTSKVTGKGQIYFVNKFLNSQKLA